SAGTGSCGCCGSTRAPTRSSAAPSRVTCSRATPRSAAPSAEGPVMCICRHMHGDDDEVSMHTDAVVVRETGAPATVAPIELAEPGSGEVLVRVEAASLCHSDLSVANGTLRQSMPIVLGHEASGIVERTGEGVRTLAAGDRVLLLWNAPCGECWFCAEGE